MYRDLALDGEPCNHCADWEEHLRQKRLARYRSLSNPMRRPRLF